jgi:dihydrofolate reductase
MRISLIVAMTRNHVIGRGGTMPWHLPADLQRFKQLTMDKPIIMGRKTFEALGGILPGRRHIVISRRQDYQAPDAEVVKSLDAALAAAQKAKPREAFVIGGSEIFREALPRADRLYMTLIDADIEGDTCFPTLKPSDWQEAERATRAPDDKNPHPLTFVTLIKRP